MFTDTVFFTDTHCHLNFHAFDEDREAVLERARRLDVGRILIPGIDVQTSQEALNLAEKHPEVFAAAGIHPHDAVTWNENSEADLVTLMQNPKSVAIGEIGLDYYHNHSPHHVQLDVFRAQLELAATLGKPVIIHCREADGDILAILSGWCARLRAEKSALSLHPGVLHSFSGDVAFAEAAIQLGFYLGITGPVTFNNAEKLRQVVIACPLENLLTETDAPFLTPHPMRGQRNEPSYVRQVVEKIAQLKNLSMEAVAQATSQNANTLFAWSN
jgi:TatD DNase family protein